MLACQLAMRTSTRLVLLAALVAAASVAVFPPYQDEYGYSRGHSLVGSPPPPRIRLGERSITMPDGTVITLPAEPAPPPARIDWPLLLRSEVVVALAAWALIVVRRMQISTLSKRIATACLLAWLLPIPFLIAVVPPLAMLPSEMYTGGNHGIPGIVFILMLYVPYAVVIFLAMTGWTLLRARKMNVPG